MLVNLVDHQNTKLSAETKNQALNHHIFRFFTVLSFVDNHQYIYSHSYQTSEPNWLTFYEETSAKNMDAGHFS